MTVTETSLVTSAKQDQRNAGLMAAESLGDFSLRHGACEASDLSDLSFGQKFFEVSDAADVDGVQAVGLIVNPFKIGDDVVPFIAVNVVDHWQIERVGDEGECNKTVGMNVLGFAVFPQADLKVSEAVFAWAQNPSAVEARFASITNANSIKTADIPKRADFVKIFVAGDRNWSPFFRSDGIHSAGCPSAHTRLAIKDSPNVATNGESAHYDAASHYFQ